MYFIALLSSIDTPVIKVVMPGSQVITVLLAGLLMVFGFQTLLTLLGIVFGAVAVKFKLKPDQDVASTEDSGIDGKTIGAIAGLSILFPINIALLLASFLAIKLSQVDRAELGAILGLVLWCAYFLLLTWLGSSAVSSLTKALLGATFNGFSTILSAVGSLFDRSPKTELTKENIESELAKALEKLDLETEIENYLERLQSQHDRSIAAEKRQDLSPTRNRSELNQEAKAELSAILQQQSQLNAADTKKLLDRLQVSWQDDSPVNLVEQLLAVLPSSRLDTAGVSASKQFFSSIDISALLQKIDSQALLKKLFTQIDLSDFDVMDIWQQFQNLKQNFTGTQETNFLNIWQAELENYLIEASVWDLHPEALSEELRDRFYDSEANPFELRRQLEEIEIDRLKQVLEQRADLTAEQSQAIVDRLETILREAIADSQLRATQTLLDDWQQQLNRKLESLNLEELQPQTVIEHFQDSLAKIDLTSRKLLLDRLEDETIEELLSPLNLNSSAEALIKIRDNYRTLHSQIAAAIAEIPAQLNSYFLYTSLDKLDPKAIEHKLQSIVENPLFKTISLTSELPKLDIEAIDCVLSRRKGLDASRRQEMLATVNATWNELGNRWESTATVQTTYQKLIIAVKEHLRDKGVAEMTLEDLKPYLWQLIENPDKELSRLGKELNEIDWQPLVKSLAAENLSQQQIDRTLHTLKRQLYRLAKLPRRWAVRVSDKTNQWQSQLRNYFRYQHKKSFDLTKMNADLQPILAKISDNLPESEKVVFDRDTIKIWLSARKDLTTVEIERIIDYFISIEQKIVTESSKSPKFIDETIAKVTDTFQSLDRTEIDLENLQQDIQNLLSPLREAISNVANSPNIRQQQSWLTESYHRLTTLNRETISSMLKTRNDLSEAAVNLITERVEQVRDRLLDEVKQVQTQIARQTTEVVNAALQALLWLLAIAVTSAISSVIAGILAVG